MAKYAFGLKLDILGAIFANLVRNYIPKGSLEVC